LIHFTLLKNLISIKQQLLAFNAQFNLNQANLSEKFYANTHKIAFLQIRYSRLGKTAC